MSEGNSRVPTENDQPDSAPQGAEVVSDTSREPELLERLEKIEGVVAVSEVLHERHSGPMPSPKQLAEYDKVLPGTAKIIREEFQANGGHVRTMEARAVEYHKHDNVENRKIAERLIWAALAATVLLALAGHDWVAGTIAVSTVGAVVTGFLNKRMETRDAKKEDASEGD